MLLCDTESLTFNSNAAPPAAISLMSSEIPMSTETQEITQILTCVYEGIPRPLVEWQVNQHRVGSDHTVMESLVPEVTDRYKSVLTLPEDGAQRASMYSCILKNEFGTTQMSIVLNNGGIIVLYIHWHVFIIV